MHLWSSAETAGCMLASPLRAETAAGTRLIVASGDGRVLALDPQTGTAAWSVVLAHPDGEMAHVIATPVIVPGNRLVVAWQNVKVPDGADPAAAQRSSHRVAVVDLESGLFVPSCVDGNRGPGHLEAWRIQ